MAKMIKFNLALSGATVSTFDELQDHFSAEILPIYRSGRLLKWLQARELSEQVQTVQAMATSDDDSEQLGALCRALGLDDDAEVITFLLEDWQANQARQNAQATTVQTATANTSNAVGVDEDEVLEDAQTATGATVDWSGQDMTGRNFEGEDFRQGKFVGTNFSGSVLTGVNFTGADLSGAIFGAAGLSRGDTEGAKFPGANLTGAKFSGGNFSGCDFAKANLTDANFVSNDDSLIGDVNLTGANFFGAAFHNTQFKNANLSEANFSKASLTKIDFSECRLHMTNFESADLSFSDLSANFDRATLLSLNRSKATALFGASILSAPPKVSGAANFKNAKLTGVTGLTRDKADELTANYAAAQ